MKPAKQSAPTQALPALEKKQGKKDPYQEIIDMLDSYEEGCAKLTMADARDECCAHQPLQPAGQAHPLHASSCLPASAEEKEIRKRSEKKKG